MATPSKLDILRAAGKVQREFACESGKTVADVHDSNVTTRRKAPDPAPVDPVDQIDRAQGELQDVNLHLDSDRHLLYCLRGTMSEPETEFEEFTDAEDATSTGAEDADLGGIDDNVGPPPTRDRVKFNLGDATPPPETPYSQEWFSSTVFFIQAQAIRQKVARFLGVAAGGLVPAL